MDTRPLGNTPLQISAMGLGGMRLSIGDRPESAQAIAVIHQALDLGVTLIDTADSYCKDESDKHHNEHLIHEALQQYSGDTSQVVVATKGGLMRPDGAWTRNGSPTHLRETIAASFEALGGKAPIALWQYHAPDPNYPLQDSLAVVKAAVQAGQIRYVGVSNFSVEQIQQAQEVVEIVSVQNQYNPWHRQPEIDGVLDYCDREGLTFFPWGPIGGTRHRDQLTQTPAIHQLATAKGVSPAAIVLAWLMAKSPRIVPIPGSSKVENIRDCLSAVEVYLTPDEVDQVDRATG